MYDGLWDSIVKLGNLDLSLLPSYDRSDPLYPPNPSIGCIISTQVTPSNCRPPIRPRPSTTASPLSITHPSLARKASRSAAKRRTALKTSKLASFQIGHVKGNRGPSNLCVLLMSRSSKLPWSDIARRWERQMGCFGLVGAGSRDMGSLVNFQGRRRTVSWRLWGRQGGGILCFAGDWGT